MVRVAKRIARFCPVLLGFCNQMQPRGRARIRKRGDRPKPWQVAWREGEARKARHFATEGEARRFAAELGLETAAPELAVSMSERVLLSRMRDAAALAGVSLESVVEAVLRETRAAVARRVELAEAMRLFLEDCERRNLREKTVLHYRWTLGRFVRSRAPGGCVGEVTREEVTAWVCSVYVRESSRQTLRTPLHAWLRWCGRRGWTDAARWREPLRWHARREDGGSPGILRPAQARRLLDALPPKFRPGVALLFLCGLRPMELMRMDWSAVDRRRRVIEVPSAMAKTRTARTLSDLPPAVWRWVAWAGEQGLTEGRVVPSNYRNFRERIRRTMRAQGLGEWPQDASRHSFASYGYHFFGAERTVELMGHVAGFGLFARRYKAAARAWTARLWFEGLGPRGGG